MKTISYDDLRRNLSVVLDGVVEGHTPIIIKRGGGKPPAVLMSLEDFASYEETLHLLRSPRNAERLLGAVAALDQGESGQSSVKDLLLADSPRFDLPIPNRGRFRRRRPDSLD